MLHIHLLTVGDLPKGSFEQIGEKLKTPLKSFVQLQHTVYKTVEKAEEAAKKADYLIVLEANGKQMSSEELAQTLKHLEDSGKHLTFLIGGAHGLSPEIKTSANLLLSLSRMTFTHDFSHLLLLEQIYRGMSIVHNRTYHY